MASAQLKNFDDMTSPFKNNTVVPNEPDKIDDFVDKTVGEIFQRTRQQKRLELNEVARILNISPRFIKAIEAMDIAQLPEKVYTLGFVRSYAKYLHMNEQRTVEEFRTIFYNNGAAIFENSKPNLRETNLPSRKTLLFSSIMLVVTIVSWLIYQKTSLVSRSKILIERPVILSNKAKLPEGSFTVKNPPIQFFGEGSSQKISEINNEVRTLHSTEVGGNPVIKPDVIMPNHSDSQMPFIIPTKVSPPIERLPAPSQASLNDVEKLPPAESEKISEDNTINFDFLPRSKVTSPSN